jgi:hypothetical protein
MASAIFNITTEQLTEAKKTKKRLLITSFTPQYLKLVINMGQITYYRRLPIGLYIHTFAGKVVFQSPIM